MKRILVILAFMWVSTAASPSNNRHHSPFEEVRTPIIRNVAQIHRDFTLVNYYGALDEAPASRINKTLTGLDEYKLIIRSLLILNVLINTQLSNTAAAQLIAQGFPDTEFKFEPLPMPKNMVPNIEYLRELLVPLVVDDVIQGYILHDLGKCLAFVLDNHLTNDTPTATAHDEYLERYLNEHPNLKSLFNNPQNNLFIKILDLLGHNPRWLQPNSPYPSLKMVAEIAIFIKEYAEEIQIKQIPLASATRAAITRLLINKAKNLGIATEDISALNPQSSFLIATLEQQQKLAFLMWLGGLRLTNTGDELSTFEQAWGAPQNASIVKNITLLLINNLEQTGDYCMLYNVTGMLHKTDRSAGLKAFLELKENGGMGAHLEEVVTVAFPFILNSCHNDELLKIIRVGHNEFQAQQLIELIQNLLPHLGGITEDMNVYPTVDFGSLKVNKELEQYLELKRQESGGTLCSHTT
ncbi:MAG: hypothetical protein J0I93_13430 [Legionella sp.]|nr:hypothetical protein [Legionella sp.]